MTEATVSVRIPAPLLRYGLSQDDIQHRVTEWLVLALFTEGRISSGKAGRLLSMSRADFLTLLRARGIAYVNYTTEEMEEELAAVSAIEVQTGP